jgi:hypothetical protein
LPLGERKRGQAAKISRLYALTILNILAQRSLVQPPPKLLKKQCRVSAFAVHLALRFTMASVTSSNNPNVVSSYSPKSICLIVGYACIAGFLIDMLVLALPPSPTDSQWRVGFVQQVADRSIILLFGAALIIFGLSARNLLKQFSRICLLIGALLFLACPLVIADTVKIQQQAVNGITAKASEIKSQIDQAKANPSALPQNVNLDQLDAYAKTIPEQTDTMVQNARTTSIKAGVAIVGNLVVVGLGMIGLGRYGMQSRAR